MFDIGKLTIAKSALVRENLQNKIDLGATCIELQLLGELYDITGKDLFDKNVDLFREYPIEIIHTPLYKGQDITVEYESDGVIFNRTCELAQLVAELKGIDILVVVHSENMPSALNNLGVLNSVKSRIKYQLEVCPNIRIGIENTTSYLFWNTVDIKELRFKDSCSITDNKICLSSGELAEYIDNDRVGCVVDYCHALMTERFMTIMRNYCSTVYIESLDVCAELFNNYSEKVFLYHLSLAKDAGTGINHGCSYHWDNQEEIDVLNRFFDLYKQCHPKGKLDAGLKARDL